MLNAFLMTRAFPTFVYSARALIKLIMYVYFVLRFMYCLLPTKNGILDPTSKSLF